MLTAIGERIVPGSTEALCNRVIDRVLTMESDQTRKQLMDALAAFGTDFAGLQGASTGGPLHAQFEVIKEWIADAYWSSEKGLRELGWTGKMAWSTLPPCNHAS